MRQVRDFVQRMYATLDEEDVEPFLDLCAPDAAVEYPGEGRLPYGGVWRGREAIRQFLEAHETAEEIVRFEPSDIATAGATAFVRGHFEGRAKPGGSAWSTEFIHVLTVRRGRLIHWKAFFDTAAAVAAREVRS